MKAILRVLFVVGAVLSWTSTLACICGKEGREWSIETVNLNIKNSDLIFIGEVIKAEGESYSFKVIDVFKGSIASDTIHGEAHGPGSCSITPYIGGLWVVYTHQDERGMIDLTFCNLSRSLIKLSPGLPPPGSEFTEGKYYPAWSGKDLPVVLQEWMQEYTMLASLKKENPAPVPKEEVITEEKEVNNNNILNYVAIGLALIALLVALLKK